MALICCPQPLIVREAVKAIEEATPRIVRITPLAVPGTEPGIVSYMMSCHGGGGLVVYIEPVLPKSRILIFGSSPVAQSLSKLCKETGYAVSVVAPEANREKFPEMDFIARERDLTELGSTRAKYVVVATQEMVGSGHGEHDERTGKGTPLRTAIDPVCGMTVDVDEPGATSEHNGKLFYFCCSSCKESFETQPDKYVGSILERVV